jgi:hypothetical protein
MITIKVWGFIASTDGHTWTSDNKEIEDILNILNKGDSKYLYYPTETSRALSKAKEFFPDLEVIYEE